jgi:hypothetical protein
LKAFVGVLSLCWAVASYGDRAPDQISLVKAGIVLKLANFITWADTQPSCERLNYFPVTILGQTTLAKAIEELSGISQVKNKPIKLYTINHMADLPNCGLVVIGSDQQSTLASLLKKAQENSIVTVSDTDGFGLKGVLINLYMAQGKVKFEVNKKTLGRSNVTLSYKLLQLAKILE